MDLKDKKLLMFDLDGTLAPSKLPIQEEMANTLCGLLAIKKVCVIGGGSDIIFFDQLVSHLNCSSMQLKNLYLMPTSSAKLYIYDEASENKWKKVYEKNLTPGEKTKISEALNKALSETGYVQPEAIYGELIEDRESQISFSGVGQKAPIAVKEKWDPDRQRRVPIVLKLKEYLPDFDVKMGGMTTIDVTRKGINKANGVREMTKYLGIEIKDAVYIGDALYENGNDAIVKETGIETIQISGPNETKKIIDELIQNQ